MLIQQMDSHASSLVFFMPMLSRCSCVSASSRSTVGIIFLFFFIAMPSMIMMSSLNYQYGCISSCISALVNGQPWNMSSDTIPMCSLSSVAILILSVVMQSGMSMNDFAALTVMNMTGISSFLFVLWLYMDSQSMMNSCGLGLYSILKFY